MNRHSLQKHKEKPMIDLGQELDMDSIELKILLKPNSLSGYYAQVLEYDLAADGKDMDAALCELARVINIHVAACMKLGMNPFKSLDRAPDTYFTLWETAKPVDARLPDLRPVECPTVEVTSLVMVH